MLDNLRSVLKSPFSRKKRIISYTCDNCKVQTTTNREILRCLGCGKALCEICNKYSLCPQDFQLLAPKDQKKVRKFNNKKSKISIFKPQYIFVPILFLPVMFIPIFILVNEPIVTGMLSFMMVFFVTFGIISYFTIFRNYEEREGNKINAKIKRILMGYNIPQHKHQEIAQEVQSVNYCPNCGAKVKESNLIICETCGASLNSAK